MPARGVCYAPDSTTRRPDARSTPRPSIPLRRRPRRRGAGVTRDLYITGTDTGVGKTVVSAALIAALNAAGVRTLGMKPVASGSERRDGAWRNADAELLIAHGVGAPDYATVNPYALAEPIAPHIAARDAGVEIRREPIAAAFATLKTQADAVVVEGVGGWSVPFSDALMQADVVRALGLPVVLVVGLRLGCLNHALLSARAIAADGCRLLGWIGNQIDPNMARVDENLATLRARLPAPCLGLLPFAGEPDPSALASALDAAVAAMSLEP